MRIAYIYDAVYPWETGGVQKRIWELAQRLADDHDVHWFGLQYWDGPRVIDREGVTLHGVDRPRPLYVDGRRSITEALSYSLRLGPALFDDQFDVVDCQVFPYFSCYATAVATLADSTALAFTWHEVWREYWTEYLGRKGVIGRLVERGTASLPGTHVVVSRRTQRELASLGRSDSRLVPNGIAVDDIAEIPAADAPVEVLFVGRFIPEKNPALLVHAIDELRETMPDVRCWLVGDGPVRDEVESLVATAGLAENVTVLDFRADHDEVIALMKAADVFVMPSRREGFGMTVLEALGSGTPVVTTDHPHNAATELVEDGTTGQIVSMEPIAIANGIEAAMHEIDSQACVEFAAAYDWDEIALEAEALYRSLEP